MRDLDIDRQNRDASRITQTPQLFKRKKVIIETRITNGKICSTMDTKIISNPWLEMQFCRRYSIQKKLRLRPPQTRPKAFSRNLTFQGIQVQS